MSALRNQLEESHKDLHQWILMHQECLLLGLDDYACQALEAFDAYLRTHIAFENDQLMPNVVADNLRWPIRLYRKEHDKLLAMLENLQRKFDAYKTLQGRRKRLFLLEFLDAHSSFYHVIEHHEEREEQDIFDFIPDDAVMLHTWGKAQQVLEKQYGALKETLKQVLEEA